MIMIVSHCRNLSATIVEPMVMPRKVVTMLAISF